MEDCKHQYGTGVGIRALWLPTIFLLICLTVTKCRHDSLVSFGFENMRRTFALCFPVTMMLKTYILDSTQP